MPLKSQLARAPAACNGQTSQPGLRPAQPRAPLRTIASVELFGGDREVVILHADKAYVLRHTRKGKLILTK